MNVLITGGAGFVGSKLSDFLLRLGYKVIAVGHKPRQAQISHNNYQYIAADTTQTGEWQDRLSEMDAVVNLAGRSIFKRWSDSYKQQIYDSRILTTRNVVSALPGEKNIILCSASGAGYYGSRGDDFLKEDDVAGDDFLAQVSVDWEKEAFLATQKGHRTALMRFGVVLDKSGGALAQMIPAFKAFVGGAMGSGEQWFPWIHLRDLLEAIAFIFAHPEIQGPVNFCAPTPTRNKDFAKALGRVLGRPSFMPAPRFMLRMALGEFSSVLLASQRTLPDKLIQSGFKFAYPDVEGALQTVV